MNVVWQMWFDVKIGYSGSNYVEIIVICNNKQDETMSKNQTIQTNNTPISKG